MPKTKKEESGSSDSDSGPDDVIIYNLIFINIS